MAFFFLAARISRLLHTQKEFPGEYQSKHSFRPSRFDSGFLFWGGRKNGCSLVNPPHTGKSRLFASTQLLGY